MLNYNPKIPDNIKFIARELRKNMTNSELLLWENIKQDKLGIRFLRQKPIFIAEEQNKFKRFIIPDFVSIKSKLIVEVDGGIHDLKEVDDLDIEKEDLLKNLGYKILRFKNEELSDNMELVLRKIKNNITL